MSDTCKHTLREKVAAIPECPLCLAARVAELEGSLKEIARQHKSDEWEEEGDTEAGYDGIIGVARSALV